MLDWKGTESPAVAKGQGTGEWGPGSRRTTESPGAWLACEWGEGMSLSFPSQEGLQLLLFSGQGRDGP